MAPQPALKTDEIVALINELHQTIADPSPFDLARLDTAIRKLGNEDRAASQCFRGVYYALHGDLANAARWFDMALSVHPVNPDIYMNYAIALSRLEQHGQAVKMALEYVHKCGGAPDAISCLLRCAYNADDHEMLNEWLPRYEKLSGGPHEIASWIQEDAEDEAEIEYLRKESRNGPVISLDKLCKDLGL